MRARCRSFISQLDQTKFVSTADVEPYAKAGATNPVVDIFIYDLETKETVRVDVRDGKPFDNSVVGHYVYGVSWTRDGELLFHRTNRRQNIMEFCAADPETGKCRVIVREEWPASWTENSPDDAFPERRQALHLDLGAQRLEEFLSLRSQREVARAR